MPTYVSECCSSVSRLCSSLQSAQHNNAIEGSAVVFNGVIRTMKMSLIGELRPCLDQPQSVTLVNNTA